MSEEDSRLEVLALLLAECVITYEWPLAVMAKACGLVAQLYVVAHPWRLLPGQVPDHPWKWLGESLLGRVNFDADTSAQLVLPACAAPVMVVVWYP